MSILCKGDILEKQKNVVGENCKVKVITLLSGQQNTIGEIQKMLGNFIRFVFSLIKIVQDRQRMGMRKAMVDNFWGVFWSRFEESLAQGVDKNEGCTRLMPLKMWSSDQMH